MMTRLMVAGLVGMGVCAAVLALVMVSPSVNQVATGKTRTERQVERQEIRQMPLLERPNRPGHFYGNTVRRLNQTPSTPN